MELALGAMYRSTDYPEELDKAIQYATAIDQPDARSYVLAEISIKASKRHQFGKAMRLADQCQADDKMRALAALIVSYNS
jgi:hypothetical protein